MFSTSLYSHIPFCQKKCFYCSFAVSIGQEERMEVYLKALQKEARHYKGRAVETIYIGGGTPSMLEEPQLEIFFRILQDHFQYRPQAEFTLEANPETIGQSKAKLLKKEGVNRISLGVQSFHDRYLKYLGRNHNSQKALHAFTLLREAGFDNINVDLMISFPQQTLEELREDIQAVTRLDCEHVSVYSLTIEEKSRFYVKGVQLDEAVLQRDQYLLIIQLLEAAGYHQYEVSNFAKMDKESRHNINYWQGGNYIGLGMSAHSHNEGRRYWNKSRLMEYLEEMKDKDTAIDGEEFLNNSQRLSEALMFGLRMNRGVDLKKLVQRFSAELDETKCSAIEKFIEQGLLEREGHILRATIAGRLLLDEIAARLI